MFLIYLTVYCLIVIWDKKNYNLIMNKIINMQTDFLLINRNTDIYQNYITISYAYAFALSDC